MNPNMQFAIYDMDSVISGNLLYHFVIAPVRVPSPQVSYVCTNFPVYEVKQPSIHPGQQKKSSNHACCASARRGISYGDFAMGRQNSYATHAEQPYPRVSGRPDDARIAPEPTSDRPPLAGWCKPAPRKKDCSKLTFEEEAEAFCLSEECGHLVEVNTDFFFHYHRMEYTKSFHARKENACALYGNVDEGNDNFSMELKDLEIPLALYFIRRYREYRWGYFKNGKKNLHDKVFIVTGASSGLGKETVKELALREATIIMACRDMERAKYAIADIRSSVKGGELVPMELDLTSFESIRHFSKEVQQKYDKINVLINNAGVSVPPNKNELTKDGFEINFGTNHLGHFLLTNLLLDKLVQSSPSRIVIVSSSLHQHGVIDLNNLHGEKGWFSSGTRNPAYNNSKLANIYFCRELAKRLPPGVETYALCPGFCYTGLFRHYNIKWYQYFIFLPVAFLFMKTANVGCQTILHCALSDDVKGKSGKIFRDCAEFQSSYEFSEEIQKKLWEVSEGLTMKKSFYKH